MFLKIYMSINFYYPINWVVSRNPLALGLSEQSLLWANEMNLINAENLWIEGMIKKFDTSSFAGWLYPLAKDVRVLQIVSDYVLWWTALDDELERSLPSISDEERQLVLQSCESLLDGKKSVATILKKYVRGWRDVLDRCMDIIGEEHFSTWVQRFIELVKQSLRSIILEEPAAYLQWQNMEFYRDVRPESTGFIMYLSFMEITDRCYLPRVAASDERIRRLRNIAALIFGLFNDVLSMTKENTGKPAFNAVLIKQHETSCSLANAVAEITDWHNQLVEEFEHLSEEIARSYDENYSEIHGYINGTHNLIVGFAEWGLRAKRYASRNTEQIQIVRNALKE